MPSFLVGKRDRYHAIQFMEDLAGRLNNRIQLSTDALRAYPDAVEIAFGADIDYGQIVKEYASPAREDQRKYSPAMLVAVYKSVVNGVPNPSKVCTSYIERANLTMRLHCKRLARLTLAFSKKFKIFRAAVALHFAYYNFVKTHGSLRCTPAMAAGLTAHIWSVWELLEYKVAPTPWVEPKRVRQRGKASVCDPTLPKRPRGRPRKHPLPDPNRPKRPRGRPRKLA